MSNWLYQGSVKLSVFQPIVVTTRKLEARSPTLENIFTHGPTNIKTKRLSTKNDFKDRVLGASTLPTVAFEEVPLGSGGGGVLSRTSSRQCLACAHKAKLNPEVPQPAPGSKLISELDPGSVPVFAPRTAPVPEPRVREVRMSDKPEMHEALEERDPNHLNQHVQIVWDDIIGEPEGARSPECAWRLSHHCFRHARNWCYTLLSVILAPPCALLLGCGFACLAFEQIWCTAPCLRCVKIYFASVRTFVQSCMAATVVPAAEAVGHVCRHVRVNWRKDAQEERDLLVV